MLFKRVITKNIMNIPKVGQEASDDRFCRQERFQIFNFFCRRKIVCGQVHAFCFISNTFIINARLKFADFQNLSLKILRTSTIVTSTVCF